MDWIIWTIGGIILLGFLVGIYRGAARIAVSIATAILTIVITFFVTPYVTGVIIEKTPLDDSMRESIVNSIEEMTADFLGTEEDSGEADTAEKMEEQETSEGSKEIPRDIQIQTIEGSDLPEEFKNLLTENNNSEIYKELGVETFSQYAGMYLANLMIHVATFLAIFLLVTIVLRAIVFALNIVNDIPVFGLMNRLAGGIVGAGFSLLGVWFLMVIIVLLYSTEVGKELYEVLQANDWTRLLMENNPLLKISLKF